MKFTNKIKTNWHDTDAHRNVRASKIVEYMQETANAQCESSGLPLEKLRDERGLAFILGALSINIYSPLHAYEEIEVRTWCKEAKSYIFNRYFEIYRGDGVDRIYCISAIRIPPPFPALAPEMSSLFFGLRVHCVH